MTRPPLFQWRRTEGLPFPVLVVGMRRLPGRIVGISLGPAVFVQQRYLADEATILHELVHSRQFWRNGLILHFLRYWLSRSYRLRMEVEAFRAELAWRSPREYPSQLEQAAQALSGRYGLRLPPEQARRLLDIHGSMNA